MPETREELLSRLLSGPLDHFVEERNRLARELRASGDRDTASWLAALRRPAPHVWALDQLAHRDQHAVRTLTNLGRRLADAQSRTVRGDREAAREMQELSRELQRAVDDAARRGLEVLREAGHGAAAGAALSMANTLRAVLAGDDAARAELEEGRLLAPVEPGFGFGAGSASWEPMPAPSPAVTGRSAAPAERDPDPRRVAAEAAAEAATAAEREVFQRRTEQRRADDRVTALRTRLQEVQAELSAAEEESRAAGERVRQAVEAARAARREADRLAAAGPG